MILIVALGWQLIAATSGMAIDSVTVTPHSLVPEGKIIMTGDQVPEWKKTWDEARNLVLSGNYAEAVRLYKLLLEEKKDLEEARWELARLQIHLKKGDEAALLLELLLEANHQQIDYLNALGQIVWEKGKFDRAVDLFGRAAEIKPDDQTALAGLVEGYIKLNKKNLALPLLERLNNLSPSNRGVHRYLALLAFELGEYEKARVHLTDLAGDKDADQEILLRTAQTHDRLGLDKPASTYWLRVLAREPENIEAHARLAAYYERTGKPGKALNHLFIVRDQSSDKNNLAKKIGNLYVRIGNFAKALPYYERYLDDHPNDQAVLKALVKGYAGLVDKNKALAALERYFAVSRDTDPDNLKMAARLYEAQGRYHEAIPIYRQLIDISPNDPEILAALVNDLLQIGENEGALSTWQKLADMAPDPLSIYRSMAELLERLERTEELARVLELIHELAPADESVIIKLAVIRIEQDDLAAARKLFAKLSRPDIRDADYLSGRGLLFEKQQLYEKALKAFEELLEFFPEQKDVRTTCIRLAGELGKAENIFNHLAAAEKYLAGSTQDQDGHDVELQMAKAVALHKTGFYDLSFKAYADILSGPYESGYVRQARLGIIALYREKGLHFEAGQVLRLALLNDPVNKKIYLRKLFELELESGRFADAATWLAELQQINPAKADPGMNLLRARLFWKEGYRRAALKICRNLLNKSLDRDLRRQTNIVLGRFLLFADKLIHAEEIGRQLSSLAGNSRLEGLVLLNQVYQRSGETIKAREISSRLMSVVEQDLANQLRLTGIFSRYGDFQAMFNTTQAAYQKNPDSLKAKFFMLEARKGQGKPSQALILANEILQDFPDNAKAELETAYLSMQTGKFAEALARCENILGRNGNRPDLLLLKARILWGMDQWTESINIYKEYLSPPVIEALAERAKEKGLPLYIQPKRSFLSRKVFPEKEEPDWNAELMSPAHFLKMTALNDIIVPLYSRYKWQEKFELELMARRSVQKREYNRAAKLYEQLLHHDYEESLLFDLAGINSRLDRLGVEAALYERLAQINPEYPGLADAVQRNRLKRRPQLSLEYGRREDTGRDNYLAMYKEWQNVEAWFSLRTLHEISLNVARIHYQATDRNNKQWANRASLSYHLDLVGNLSIDLSGGVEDLEKGPATGIFSCRLFGRFGDLLEGKVSFSKDIIADTMASLQRNITRNDFEAGMQMDILPRLLVGGDYGRREYSDNNQSNRYKLWSSYILFPEPTLFKLGYAYDYYDTRHGPNPGANIQADGFSSADHPYWTPKDYWQNRFIFYFKHQLSNDKLKRGIPRYYTVEYSLGHDSNGHDLQDIRGNLFIELTKSFILKASAEATTLKGQQGREVVFSAAYRW